jgi:2-polyprenyl-3-methyl-5-hydroxy-6-metoxy-1,4-benzoquinol methylase
MKIAKPENYFSNVREDVFPLLPEKCSELLELGCAEGRTSEALKKRYGCRATGVEYDEAQGQSARSRLDSVTIGNAETVEIPGGKFDLILCLDVLEHLVDPWAVVAKLVERMTPDGSVIISVPNVQHYKTSFGVLLGNWTYTPSGALDVTHLRFFVRSTAESMLTNAGLKIDVVRCNYGRLAGIADNLTFGLFRGLLAFQYIIRARKA